MVISKVGPEIIKREVYVYRNLNRKGIIFSVRCNKTGLLIDRQPTVILKDPLFLVSKSGRHRVLVNQVRNVHAGIKGNRLKVLPRSIKRLKKAKFYYDPYKVSEFTTEDGIPVFRAKYAVLSPSGLFVYF